MEDDFQTRVRNKAEGLLKEGVGLEEWEEIRGPEGPQAYGIQCGKCHKKKGSCIYTRTCVLFSPLGRIVYEWEEENPLKPCPRDPFRKRLKCAGLALWRLFFPGTERNPT